MRLHHLRLRAFGPFAAEQRIDFDPLGVGGLFLLDGPTGAGKSTVLDAITFALYGPGARGGDGRLHSHFAAAGVAPEVELDFSVRGCRHRVTRSPEHQRPKRRGHGTMTEHARVHLERFEDGRWVSRSSNKAEVGDALADEIGLTRDQFRQVVLLPQGEFMRFLRADDDDRRMLLTKLFGAEFYARVTDELDRRRKVADQDVEDADRQVRLAVAAAAEAARLDPAVRAALAALDPCEQQRRLAALSERLAADVATSSAELAEATTALTTGQQRAAAATAAAERASRMVAATDALARHDAGRDAHDALARRLAAAEQADPVRPLLEAVADANAHLRTATRVLLRRAPHASAAWRQGDGADDLVELAADSARAAAELHHLVTREAEFAMLRAEADAVAAVADAASARCAELGARAAELPELRRAADAAVLTAGEQASSLPALRERHDVLLGRRDALAALAAVQDSHATLAVRHRTAFEQYAAAVDEHHRRVEARLANMAAELAADLADGDQCPVCGSTEHPERAAPAPGAVSADQVAEAEQARVRAERDRDALTAELADLDRRAAELGVRAAGADPDEIAAELGTTSAAIVDAEGQVARLDRLVAAQCELEVESDRVAAAWSAADREAVEAAAAAGAAAEQVAAVAAELASAADGHPSVRSRQDALQRAADDAGAVAAAVRDVRAARVSCTSATDRATAEARARGFDDVDAAGSAVLPPAEIAAARAEVTRWQAESDRLRGALIEAGDSDDRDSSAAVIKAAAAERRALADAETAMRAATVAADRAADVARRFAAARAEVEAARAHLQQLQADTAPVIHLARLARGMAGQRRVALTTYVLRHWFEQVVDAANVRLGGMSSGRYELVRVDEGVSRSERTGLTLQVLDRHTGEQRSTRSLSGGETFYTSLALALGLADVVRAEAGGVDLDTLFIDEGFGSLDADTLDDVMAVIDELRGHGRTVGIVSHVSELKHRIAERIEVRRLPDGSSALRVVV